MVSFVKNTSLLFLRLCQTLFTMSSPFSIVIHDNKNDIAQIRMTCYIRCEVVVESHHTTVTQMACCLHCKRLMSNWWTDRHTVGLRNNNVDVTQFFAEEKLEFFRRDIETEAELLFEQCRFSSQRRIQRAPRQHRTAKALRASAAPEPVDCPASSPPPCSSGAHPEAPREHETGEPCQEIRLEHEFSCVEECLLRESFRCSRFDDERFVFMASTIVNNFRSCHAKADVDSFKSRIVSSLFRRLSLHVPSQRRRSSRSFSSGGRC